MKFEALYVNDGRLENDKQHRTVGAGLKQEQQHVDRRAAEMEFGLRMCNNGGSDYTMQRNTID